MTAKKSTPKTNPEDLPTAEGLREAELEGEDLLADMPELREPRRYRLRHKNRLKEIGYKHADTIEAAREAFDSGDPVTNEIGLALLDMAADVDDFAESIAVDPAAYAEWAEQHSDDVDVFMALLNHCMSALGESSGSAS